MVPITSGLLMEMANRPYLSTCRYFNIESCATYFLLLTGVQNVEPDMQFKMVRLQFQALR